MGDFDSKQYLCKLLEWEKEMEEDGIAFLRVVEGMEQQMKMISTQVEKLKILQEQYVLASKQQIQQKVSLPVSQHLNDSQLFERNAHIQNASVSSNLPLYINDMHHLERHNNLPDYDCVMSELPTAARKCSTSPFAAAHEYKSFEMKSISTQTDGTVVNEHYIQAPTPSHVHSEYGLYNTAENPDLQQNAIAKESHTSVSTKFHMNSSAVSGYQKPPEKQQCEIEKNNANLPQTSHYIQSKTDEFISHCESNFEHGSTDQSTEFFKTESMKLENTIVSPEEKDIKHQQWPVSKQVPTSTNNNWETSVLETKHVSHPAERRYSSSSLHSNKMISVTVKMQNGENKSSETLEECSATADGRVNQSKSAFHIQKVMTTENSDDQLQDIDEDMRNSDGMSKSRNESIGNQKNESLSTFPSEQVEEDSSRNRKKPCLAAGSKTKVKKRSSSHSVGSSTATDSEDSFFDKDLPLTSSAAYKSLIGAGSALKPSVHVEALDTQSESEGEMGSEDEMERALVMALKDGASKSSEKDLIRPSSPSDSLHQVKEESELSTKKINNKTSNSRPSVSAPPATSRLSKAARKALGLDSDSDDIPTNTEKLNDDSSEEFDFYA